jgi:hypothetical protein
VLLPLRYAPTADRLRTFVIFPPSLQHMLEFYPTFNKAMKASYATLSTVRFKNTQGHAVRDTRGVVKQTNELNKASQSVRPLRQQMLVVRTMPGRLRTKCCALLHRQTTELRATSILNKERCQGDGVLAPARSMEWQNKTTATVGTHVLKWVTVSCVPAGPRMRSMSNNTTNTACYYSYDQGVDNTIRSLATDFYCSASKK